MSKKTRYKKTAQRSRGNSVLRKKQSKKGRKRRGGSKKVNPRIIANSVFALTLTDKPGFQVQQALGDSADGLGNYSFEKPENHKQLYADLLACFKRARILVDKNYSRYDPLKDGLPLGVSISHVIDSFRMEIVPAGYEFNVEFVNRNYYFSIYKELDQMEGFHMIEIKRMIDAISRSKRLHDFFLKFLRNFSLSLHINFWDEDDDTLYFIEEDIEYWENNHGTDQESMERRAELKELVEIYKNGIAAEYKRQISRNKYSTPGVLLKQLRGFPGKHPLVIWMKEALEFMKRPYGMSDFYYYEENEGYEEGLRFHSQATIVWNSDNIARWAEDRMQSEAEYGLQSPIINIQFRKNSKKNSIQWMKESSTWPREFNALLIKYYDVLRTMVLSGKKKKK